MSGAEIIAPVAGAAVGAMASKKNPLQGAMMGGLLGYGAGQMLPSMMGGAAPITGEATVGAGGGAFLKPPVGLANTLGGSLMNAPAVTGAVTGATTGLGLQGGMAPMFAAGPQSSLATGTFLNSAGAAAIPEAGFNASGMFAPPPTTPEGSLSARGVFDKISGNISRAFEGGNDNSKNLQMGMQGANMMNQQGQQQQRQPQQPIVMGAPAMGGMGGGQATSFSSLAPQGMTINTMPGGTMPTASRFRRPPLQNSYSEY